MDASLNLFIDQCEEKLKSETATKFKFVKQAVESFIEENIINRLDNKLSLQARVKGPSSLREKIIRKRYYEKYDNPENFIKELPDLIGLRLVCLLHSEEKVIFRELSKIFTHSLERGFKCLPGVNTTGEAYFKIFLEGQPEKQKNGEDIYRIKCMWVDNNEEFPMELQIKSLINMFWGEMEHMLVYKNYQYLVGSDFYGELMKTILGLLKNIDSQLAGMQIQLGTKDPHSQIQEIKQMVAKFMYDTYQPNIDLLLKCNLDCREVYDAIIFAEMKNISRANALQISSQLISKILTRPITETDFIFDDVRLGFTNSQEEKLASHFLELANSKDIFWRILFGLFNIHNSANTLETNIKLLATRLLEAYIGFQANLDTDNNGHLSLFNGIKIGVVKAFNQYKKIDYFLPGGKQKRINTIINDFVNNNEEDLFEITSQLDSIEKIIGNLICMEIQIELNLSLSNSLLNELHQLISQNDIPWLTENFNVAMLKELVEENRCIESKEELKNLLYSTGEGNII
ncbi:hypothetical protein ASG89_26090 [Paenibacillus sp. Soil766]|uniref:hypothetical protein n=1 Tax=Paenibacillus sp. Soil766 TaxID=1736404 RepID=UPI00070E80E4|nr:hypothetical protein [Paenibacillus sp. Soil766]KRF01081.1 hypothetical protein ASG89_26090 [Paenibacillus sp. Soil766]